MGRCYSLIPSLVPTCFCFPADSCNTRIPVVFLSQLVLAHVTNKLAGHVTDLTVQVFKEDWSRTGNAMTYSIRTNAPSVKPQDHTTRTTMTP